MDKVERRLNTQRAKILQHLKDNQSITPREALDFYGCMRLSAHILTLKQEGIKIVTLMKQIGNRRFAEYMLEVKFCEEMRELHNWDMATGVTVKYPKLYFKEERDYYDFLEE